MPSADRARGALPLLVSELRLERRRAVVAAVVLTAAQMLPLAAPLLLQRFVDAATDGAATDTLVTIALAYLAVGVGAQGLAVAAAAVGTTLAWAVTDRIRSDVAEHVLRLDMAFHGRYRPGEMIERVDGDVTLLSKFFSTFALTVAGSALLLVGAVVTVAFVDAVVAAVFALTTVATALVVPRLQRQALPHATAAREAEAQATAAIEERLAGLDDLRANGGGAAAVAAYERAGAVSVETSVRSESAGGRVFAGTTIVFAVGSALALATAILRHQGGAISVGAVFAVFQYTQLVRHPVEMLVDQLEVVQDALAGASRLAALLGEQTSTPDGTLRLPPGPLPVSFEGVGFGYGDGPDVLEGVDLHVPAGTVVGLVGRSGHGKTTMARLALRLWDPRRGVVRVGDMDLRDVERRSLRARVAYVTQDVQLFRASVRDNLTLFDDGRDAPPDEEVLGALEAVGLGSWAASLPSGLDTLIGGEEGIGLSAGEQQLLALARTFLAEPGVVVLDEASSRLDPASEQLVDAALERLFDGRTAIVIAHRPGALRRVTTVAVVEDGRVTDAGSRDDVLDRLGPRLAALFDADGVAEGVS